MAGEQGAAVADNEQYTDGQLQDGTTLRFKGELTPDVVKQKVAAYRSTHAPASTGTPIQDKTTDTSKGFFDPANKGEKDPFAFSAKFSEANPPQPQSIWQKVKTAAGNMVKPWEGAMAPRTPEEMLSGGEMLAGEIGGTVLGAGARAARGAFKP